MAAARLLRLGPRLGLGAPGPLRSRLFPRCFQVSAAKKAKAAGDEADKGSPLSPQQLERIRRNKEAALQRLAERNVPPGFGESWRRQLGQEFSKPYFMEVGEAGPARGCAAAAPGEPRAEPPPLPFPPPPAADGVCGRGEETPQGLPAPRAGLHLDADVRHLGCEWSRWGGWGEASPAVLGAQTRSLGVESVKLRSQGLGVLLVLPRNSSVPACLSSLKPKQGFIALLPSVATKFPLKLPLDF